MNKWVQMDTLKFSFPILIMPFGVSLWVRHYRHTGQLTGPVASTRAAAPPAALGLSFPGPGLRHSRARSSLRGPYSDPCVALLCEARVLWVIGMPG